MSLGIHIYIVLLIAIVIGTETVEAVLQVVKLIIFIFVVLEISVNILIKT